MIILGKRTNFPGKISPNRATWTIFIIEAGEGPFGCSAYLSLSL